MRIYIGHNSALAFWRRHYPAEYPGRNRTTPLALCPSSVPDTLAVDLSAFGFCQEKIDICVPTAHARCLPKMFCYHVCSSKLPPQSFVRITDEVHVASPELCFLQLAQLLSFNDLVACGYELCGSYPTIPSFDNHYENTHGPVTTREKLTRYLTKTSKVRGTKTALGALRFVLDGSASSMETAMAMLFTMPVHRGGYGFPAPEMNGEVPVDETLRKMLGKSGLRCDMFYRDKGVGIEYNSKLNHTGVRRISEDAFRANGLGYADVRVITVTPAELFNPLRFDVTAREVAHACNWRFRKPTDAQWERKLQLRAELLRQGGMILP